MVIVNGISKGPSICFEEGIDSKYKTTLLIKTTTGITKTNATSYPPQGSGSGTNPWRKRPLELLRWDIEQGNAGENS